MAAAAQAAIKREVVNMSKKELITIILVAVAIVAFICLNIAFGSGTVDGGSGGGGVPICH